MSKFARCACHEAGHVITAVVLGRQIEKVSITPAMSRAARGAADGQQGTTVLLPADATLFDQVTILMAGLQAERAWYQANFTRPPTVLSMRFGGCYHDFVAANDLGADAALVGCCESAAREIVKANWSAVEAVAAALMKRGSLSGADVANFFAPRPKLYGENRHG